MIHAREKPVFKATEEADQIHAPRKQPPDFGICESRPVVSAGAGFLGAAIILCERRGSMRGRLVHWRQDL